MYTPDTLTKVNANNGHLTAQMVMLAIVGAFRDGETPAYVRVHEAQRLAWHNYAVLTNTVEFKEDEFPLYPFKETVGGLPLKLDNKLCPSTVMFHNWLGKPVARIQMLAVPVGFNIFPGPAEKRSKKLTKHTVQSREIVQGKVTSSDSQERHGVYGSHGGMPIPSSLSTACYCGELVKGKKCLVCQLEAERKRIIEAENRIVQLEHLVDGWEESCSDWKSKTEAAKANCRKLESAIAQIRVFLASDKTTTDPDTVLESIVQTCDAVAAKQSLPAAPVTEKGKQG